MAARILDAHETETETVLVVHLDEGRVTRDGDPDPASVRTFSWPRYDPKNGATESRRDYLDRVLDAARAQAETANAEAEAEVRVEDLIGKAL